MNLITKLRSRKGTQLLISIWFILIISIKCELCFFLPYSTTAGAAAVAVVVAILFFFIYFFLDIVECSITRMDKIGKPWILQCFSLRFVHWASFTLTHSMMSQNDSFNLYSCSNCKHTCGIDRKLTIPIPELMYNQCISDFVRFSKQVEFKCGVQSSTLQCQPPHEYDDRQTISFIWGVFECSDLVFFGLVSLCALIYMYLFINMYYCAIRSGALNECSLFSAGWVYVCHSIQSFSFKSIQMNKL